MPLAGDELVCPKFQPNIFDSTRCHDCLRQKHLHHPSSSEMSTADNTHTTHTDEKDSSVKEDSDVLSVVSSYCDVSRRGRGFEDGSFCILSPDCELYFCDGDDDENSDSLCDSVYSSSVGLEEDSSLLHQHPSCHRMTRLDPCHRTSPRSWMDSAHGFDGFRQFGSSHGNVKERKERESGYFSLGRAAGSRVFRDKSPPPPYRHSERGHPLPSNKSPEPKAIIPFRNPDLGVPSERRTSEIQSFEFPGTNCTVQHTAEPLDPSVEVKVLAGPRSLSPTPFKQAEALSSSRRRGGKNLHSSPSRQPEALRPSQKGSSPSRPASPCCSPSPFRRTESSSLLNTAGFRAGSILQGRERNGPSWVGPSEGLQKNFRSFASTVGTVSTVGKSLSYMDLKGSLRKFETNSGSPVGSVENRGGSSHSRRGYDGPAQATAWKTEAKNTSLVRSHDRQSPPPSLRRYNSRSPSPLGRVESNFSSSQNLEGRRSASPVRKGYGSPSQSKKTSIYNGRSHDRNSTSPSRKGHEAQGQPAIKKPEAKSSIHSTSRDSRQSPPTRISYQNSGQSLLHKTKISQSSLNRGRSRSPSPLRWGNSTSSQSLPRKSESGRSSSISTLRYETASHTPLRSTKSDKTVFISHQKNTMSNQSQHESNPSSGFRRGSTHSLQASRNSSPSRHSSEKKLFSSLQKSTPVTRGTKQIRDKSHETQHSAPKKQQILTRTRSPSPTLQRHTSSQSSIDSESSHLSAGSSGLNREEYAMMADLPKVKTVFQREGSSHLEKPESRQRREFNLYKPASHSQMKTPHTDWDDPDVQRDSGLLSRVYSSSSLHTQRENETERETHTYKTPPTPSSSSAQHQRSVYFSCSLEQTDEESTQQA